MKTPYVTHQNPHTVFAYLLYTDKDLVNKLNSFLIDEKKAKCMSKINNEGKEKNA